MATDNAKVTDPVCGMQIDPATAAGQSEYQGTTYYFCSGACKQKYDQDPGQYTGQGSRSTP